jgi:SAM-dependent methyltransferase
MAHDEGSAGVNPGLLYDSVPEYASRGDIRFYVSEALNSSGPVLELACGTGRILLPSSRAGVSITGIELSEDMLGQCRQNLVAESVEVQNRVALHQGDVRNFKLDRKFALVTAPFRIMQLLPTIDDQMACLSRVREHLLPGGEFIFDVFNPNYRALAAEHTDEHEDTPPRMMGSGKFMRRTVRVCRVRWVDQVSEVEITYYTGDSDASLTERRVQSIGMRWFGRAELVHLLSRAGFTIERIDGDFDGSPLEDSSPEMIVTATLS